MGGGLLGFQMTSALLGKALLCPVFCRKVFFRGDYYIGYVNTFRYKHDANSNSKTGHSCNLREKQIRTRNFGITELRTF